MAIGENFTGRTFYHNIDTTIDSVLDRVGKRPAKLRLQLLQ
jgi:hypothetical protein